MCGICGVLAFERRRGVSAADLERMNATLTHRGPDDGGTWLGDGVGIAMRRLSIVDVEGGHQPITNETGDCWVVFNGEIYNHRELHDELAAKGHRFKTGSDTEAILHLYEEEGEAGFRRLDGMFAIAIVDLRRGATRPRLLLARDRLGKKPLYYAEAGGSLVFGSEIKAVLASGGISKELDREALHHYLSLLVVPEPMSIWRGVKKLPGGCVLVADEGGVAVRRYWDLGEVIGETDLAHGSQVGRVRELLFAAVKKRLDLEVPFGAFLSGGLDSGAVVGVMSQLLSRPVRTFSIGFEGPESHNELPAAALSARHFRTEHHELMARPDIVALVHDLVQFADEPLAISSAIPLLLLAREARRDVKVVLTGDGGDEVFAGYPQYTYERWARLWRKLPAFVDRGAGALTAGSARPMLRRIRRFVENSRRPSGERRLGWSSGFSEDEKRALYAEHAPPADTPELLDALLARHASRSPEAQANLLDFLIWLPDEMLAKVDRMTMAASIEARSPLLDDDLVAYVTGISFDDRLPWRPGARGKPLLRGALADLLPPHLLSGRKWGFTVPLDDWFRGGAAPFVDAVLAPDRVRARGLFDPAEVSRWVDAHRRGDVNACNRLFALVVFEVWAEHHL
jgi:asparagine synthase (glutamine-hydrolysing)